MKMTKYLKQILATAALATAFAVTTGNVAAQDNNRGRGNFDPEQMRTRMMERYREALEVKGDDEWKILEGRITKVMEAQRDTRMGMGFGGRGGPGGGGRRGGDTAGGGGNTDQARRNPFMGEPSPEAEALQKAIDSKASSDEIKAKLAKFRDARKSKEAALEKAQDDLRKVLSVRQEAVSVSMGLLK